MFVAVPSPGPLEVIASYTCLGVEHIVLGVDHLLFVGVLLAGAALIRRLAGPMAPRFSTVLPAYAIGGLASFWLIEQVVAFGGTSDRVSGFSPLCSMWTLPSQLIR